MTVADALNYLSLISAMNYPYNVQGLYSSYNPYSAASLYGGGSGEESTSFSNIFGSCVNAMMNTNASLLSNLVASNNISTADKTQLIENLEEASKDTCNCKSADFVKELYSTYLSNTTGYAKNQLNQLVKAVASETDSKTSGQGKNTSSSINKNNQEITTAINSSIPSEEDIDNIIAESISMPMSF